MNREELKKKIIEIAFDISKTNDEYQKELLRTFLNHYVELALKNYKENGEGIKNAERNY